MDYLEISERYPLGWEALNVWLKKMSDFDDFAVKAFIVKQDSIILYRVNGLVDSVTEEQLLEFFDSKEVYVAITPVVPTIGQVGFHYSVSHPSGMLHTGSANKNKRHEAREEAIKSAFLMLNGLLDV